MEKSKVLINKFGKGFRAQVLVCLFSIFLAQEVKAEKGVKVIDQVCSQSQKLLKNAKKQLGDVGRLALLQKIQISLSKLQQASADDKALRHYETCYAVLFSSFIRMASVSSQELRDDYRYHLVMSKGYHIDANYRLAEEHAEKAYSLKKTNNNALNGLSVIVNLILSDGLKSSQSKRKNLKLYKKWSQHFLDTANRSQKKYLEAKIRVLNDKLKL